MTDVDPAAPADELPPTELPLEEPSPLDATTTPEATLATSVRGEVAQGIADQTTADPAPDLPTIVAQLAALEAIVATLTTTEGTTP